MDMKTHLAEYIAGMETRNTALWKRACEDIEKSSVSGDLSGLSYWQSRRSYYEGCLDTLEAIKTLISEDIGDG